MAGSIIRRKLVQDGKSSKLCYRTCYRTDEETQLFSSPFQPLSDQNAGLMQHQSLPEGDPIASQLGRLRYKLSSDKNACEKLKRKQKEDRKGTRGAPKMSERNLMKAAERAVSETEWRIAHLEAGVIPPDRYQPRVQPPLRERAVENIGFHRGPSSPPRGCSFGGGDVSGELFSFLYAPFFYIANPPAPLS